MIGRDRSASMIMPAFLAFAAVLILDQMPAAGQDHRQGQGSPRDVTGASIERGRQLFQALACFTCHATGSDREGKMGPSLAGVHGSEREFEGGAMGRADDAYLRESVLDPLQRIVNGYRLEEGAMPPYQGIIDDAQLDSLLLFIKSLPDEPSVDGPDSTRKPGEPGRDPHDQPFRRAPTRWSSRTIAIPLAPDVHLAFDQERMRTAAVWKGKSLTLYGPPYSGTKTPFICQVDGEILWGLPPFYPWSSGASPKTSLEIPPGSDFRAVSTKGGQVTLVYDVGLGDGTGPVRVREQPVLRRIGDASAIVRRLEVGLCAEDLWFLAHAESGNASVTSADPHTVLLKSEGGQLGVAAVGPGARLVVVEEKVRYQEEIIAEASTEQGRQLETIEETQTHVFVQIAAHSAPVVVEIASVFSDEKHEADVAAMLGGNATSPTKNDGESRPLVLDSADKGTAPLASGDDAYIIEAFPLPEKADLLVGGMDWLPNGDLALCTWARGEVYIIENPQAPVEKVRYRRFARGLMEPLGLKVHDGEVYVVQKGELTRLRDTDGNGEADLQECVSDDWGFSGNYHSYAFGPEVDGDGNFHVFICGRRGRWDLPYIGWCVSVDPRTRTTSGFASGFRAPNGPGLFGPDRDLFVTDNQGDWVGACKLNHVRAGQFYGYPSGTPAPRERYQKPRPHQQPAVWIPYVLSQSASGITMIETDAFGPFQGQMLVGDFQHGTVQRVFLEKIHGQWQGAVWPFLQGFHGAVNRIIMGPDGNLYAGGCRRTWGASKPQEYSLDRVRFTGRTPFEIVSIHARPEGFELVFTEPVNADVAKLPEKYDVSQFNYKYHQTYGSPTHDHDGKADSQSPIAVNNVDVSPDRRSVKLVLTGLRAGFVTRIDAAGVISSRGRKLRHPELHYTLNHVPSQ